MDEIYAFLANNKDPEGRRLAECHLARMKAIRTNGFNEAIKMAIDSIDRYIVRRQQSSADTTDIEVHFKNRERIAGAESCKSWIDTIKEPA